MRDTDFLTWPEMKERMHYIAWLCFTLVSFPTGGHAAILLLCVSVGEYVDQQRFLLTFLAAVTLGPLAYAWRKFGERHCRFIEFDDALDRCFRRGGAGSHLGKIQALIDAIEAARGMSRQLARNEAKAWLKVHADELSAEERELVADHLGYLGRR